MRLDTVRWIAAVVLIADLAFTLGLAQAAPFTLADALSRVERAPVVTQAQQKLRQTQAELSAARAQAGLRADVSGTTSYVFAVPAPGTTPAASLGLQVSASLPVGPFSPQAVALKTAELNLEYVEVYLRLTKSDLSWRVVRGYGRVLVAEQQRQQARLVLELVRAQLAAFEGQQRLGAATTIQVLNAQLALGTAQQNLNQAEYNARDARLGLAGLLGLADLPGAVVNPASRVIPQPAASAIKTSPTVIFARIQRDRARLALDGAPPPGWPLIGVNLAYGGDGYAANLGFSTKDFAAYASLSAQPLGSPIPPSGATISVTASIPIWDGGASAAVRQSAALTLEAAQAQLEQATDDLSRQLEGALRLAALDAEALPASREAVGIAQRSLEIAGQRLKAGTATGLELLTAEVQLANAEGALLAAELRALEDVYQIDAVLGVGGSS